VISEGSCDTDDAENHRNKLHFTIYSHRKQLIYIIIIFHYFYYIFDQINSLDEQKRLSKTFKKSYQPQTFESMLT